MGIKQLYNTEEIMVAVDLLSDLENELGKDYSKEIGALNRIIIEKEKEEK